MLFCQLDSIMSVIIFPIHHLSKQIRNFAASNPRTCGKKGVRAAISYGIVASA